MAAVEKRAAGYHDRAVQFAHALRKPPFHPETVHRLRTHMRRLQAYAEFLRHPAAALRLARAVTWLSRLRMLDVFYHHLRRRRAPAKDAQRVAWALKEEAMMVACDGRLDKIRSILSRLSLAQMRRPAAVVTERLAALRGENTAALDRAFRRLSPEATRKELHRLRLLVKALRYKEEIALETPWGDPRRLAAFKHLQRTLGDYCDRDQFRRMAKTLRLSCRGALKNNYQQSKKKTQAAVRKLGPPTSR